MQLDFGIKGLILNEGKFLAMHKVSSVDKFYELPGGRMEYGETIEETLQRELLEETGLKVKPVRLLDTWNYINEEKQHQVAGVIYLCEVVGGNSDVQLSDEHDSYRWLEPSGVHLMNQVFAPKLEKWNWDILN
jgi:8-oxo-dGTP pyrophosphatase MutT (NUDIX family)